MSRVNVPFTALDEVRYRQMARALGVDVGAVAWRFLRVYARCTDRETYDLTRTEIEILVEIDGKIEHFVDAALDADLLRPSSAQVGKLYVAGTRGRIEWLAEQREKSRKGGEARARQAAARAAGDEPFVAAEVPLVDLETAVAAIRRRHPNLSGKDAIQRLRDLGMKVGNTDFWPAWRQAEKGADTGASTPPDQEPAGSGPGVEARGVAVRTATRSGPMPAGWWSGAQDAENGSYSQDKKSVRESVRTGPEPGPDRSGSGPDRGPDREHDVEIAPESPKKARGITPPAPVPTPFPGSGSPEESCESGDSPAMAPPSRKDRQDDQGAIGGVGIAGHHKNGHLSAAGSAGRPKSGVVRVGSWEELVECYYSNYELQTGRKPTGDVSSTFGPLKQCLLKATGDATEVIRRLEIMYREPPSFLNKGGGALDAKTLLANWDRLAIPGNRGRGQLDWRETAKLALDDAPVAAARRGGTP